jgi:hypothetical protein
LQRFSSHFWQQAEPMSKWIRIIVALGIVGILGGTYLWFFGIQTFFVIQTRKWGREVPIVKSVPIELQDSSVSKAQGEKLSFMGVEFEVPWDDVDEAKTRIVGSWALIHFRSGNSILLCVEPPKGFMNALFHGKTQVSPELFTSLFGPDVLSSDYELKKAIFETTPSEVTLLTPSNRAAGFTTVIMIKAIMPPTTDWAIYNIRNKNMKGFQLGDPIRRPKKMSLELVGDDVEAEINIEQVQSGPTDAITQADINRMIESAHSIANAQPVLSVNPGQMFAKAGAGSD